MTTQLTSQATRTLKAAPVLDALYFMRHLFLILLICFSQDSFALSKYLTERDLKQFYLLLDEVGFEKPKNSDNILLLVDKVEKGKATLVQGEYELELANDQRDWCRNIRVKFEAHKNINSAWSFSGSVHYSAQVTYAPNSSSCYDKDNVSFGVNRPHTDKELSKLKTDLEKLISQQSKLWEEKSANELNYRLPEFAMGMPWTVVQVDTSERHGSAAIFQKYNVLAIVRLILNQESLVIQDVSFSVK